MTRTTALNHAWQLTKSWIRAYVLLSVRHPWWVLGTALVSTVGAGLAAQNLRVNPRLDALLPTDTVSARSLEEMSRRVRSTSPLYLLVKSSDLQTSRRLAKELHDEVSNWPDAQWVMQRRDPSYFTDRRLLMLSQADLESFTDDIEERVRWEECSRMPGCVNIDDEAPALPDAASLQRSFSDNADLKMLASVLGTDAQALFKPGTNDAKSEVAPKPAGAGSTQATVDNNTSEKILRYLARRIVRPRPKRVCGASVACG